MTSVHIVGAVNSFTYNACENRYSNGYSYKHYKHAELVDKLLKNKIPKDEASIVPLWNSNSGTVDMDRKTRTTQLFMGKAGNIVDLWPEGIVYELGVKGGGELLGKCDIYSVHIAKDQCSQFLKEIDAYNSKRFRGEDTTTDAAQSFLQNAKTGDGLLCGRTLLESSSLISNGDITNPNNFTVFSTINTLPKPREQGDHVYSLAGMLVDLNGDNLPYDFVNYWQQLLSEKDAEGAENIFDEMPKIVFVIRYEDAKALLLLEMTSKSMAEDPWPSPDVDADSGFEVRSEMGFIEQVGGIYDSFVETERKLFMSSFIEHEGDILFYGSGESFLWGSPALRVFVHGFDPNLVKECARLQVNRLVQLMKYGISMPATAQDLLQRFEADAGNVRLSSASRPDQA